MQFGAPVISTGPVKDQRRQACSVKMSFTSGVKPETAEDHEEISKLCYSIVK
jgi:hypothetical protein